MDTNPTSFSTAERVRATAWKAITPTLADADRRPAPYRGRGKHLYPFCLPPDSSLLNLLPDVREGARALFRDLGIPWHAGVNGGPTNHLLSSQVQCVNALWRMVADPQRLRAAFGGDLDIDEVLEIEEGRPLTFEYIGPTDYFGEAKKGVRIRGSQCTSVDAAFLFRTSRGTTELALVEWKYTEHYRRRTVDPKKDEIRRQRYQAALQRSDSPIDWRLMPFERFLDEPFYQLMRQQLLAAELERDRVLGADAVRVVHVHPAANLAYQESMHHPEQRGLGTTVAEVWQRLLTRPDRYTELDNDVFLDPAITSSEYVARYG